MEGGGARRGCVCLLSIYIQLEVESCWLLCGWGAFSAQRSVMSYVCSMYQMGASFTKWNLYSTCIRVVQKSTTTLSSCRFFYNSDALST